MKKSFSGVVFCLIISGFYVHAQQHVVLPYVTVGVLREEMTAHNNYTLYPTSVSVVTPNVSKGYFAGIGALYNPKQGKMPYLSCDLNFWRYEFTTGIVFSHLNGTGLYESYDGNYSSITTMIRIAPAITFGRFDSKKLIYYSSTGFSYMGEFLESQISDYFAIHTEVGIGWNGYILKGGFNYGLTKVGGGQNPDFDMRSRNIYCGINIIPAYFLHKLDPQLKQTKHLQ